ncbi:hypothetical protein L6R50_19945 [Myxococcota bacterium]|nr:hypothetical protein [Myxococcota bacterium]
MKDPRPDLDELLKRNKHVDQASLKEVLVLQRELERLGVPKPSYSLGPRVPWEPPQDGARTSVRCLSEEKKT